MAIVVRPMATLKFNTNKRRVAEKKRIQTLKMWHEDLKKIARSEMNFISSIFQDDKNTKDRDWIRDDEESSDEEADGSLVKADA